MKKIEIKKFGVLNALKITTYMTILPSAFCFLIGIGFVLIGVLTKQREMLIMGIAVTVVYPIVLVIMYGVMAMLGALIYNLFAGKFGGLELTVKEDEPFSQIKKDGMNPFRILNLQCLNQYLTNIWPIHY
ncbi:MAG: DUF3566 domain-containing protein [Planctomycetota bacterium]